jgi:hypothetical protein
VLPIINEGLSILCINSATAESVIGSYLDVRDAVVNFILQ